MRPAVRASRYRWSGFGSESDGLINVTATTSGGAHLLHTATDSDADVDEVTIRAVNNSAADVLLSLGFGGVGAGNLCECTIPMREGFVVVTDGLRLRGGMTIVAWAATTAVINVKVDVARRSLYEEEA